MIFVTRDLPVFSFSAGLHFQFPYSAFLRHARPFHLPSLTPRHTPISSFNHSNCLTYIANVLPNWQTCQGLLQTAHRTRTRFSHRIATEPEAKCTNTDAAVMGTYTPSDAATHISLMSFTSHLQHVPLKPSAFSRLGPIQRLQGSQYSCHDPAL